MLKSDKNSRLDVMRALRSLVWNYGAGDIVAIDLVQQTVRTRLQYGFKLYHFAVSASIKKITVKMLRHQRTIRNQEKSNGKAN